MLKILYQLCTWNTSVRNAVHITPVYVDTIKILGANILSRQKQPSCKKKGAALFKMASIKKVVKSKLAAKKWL